ncbi:MAG: hypothetical protein EXS09_11755 [Gemmataceae bacterium]|nr:hypothetical protein [Gemmataceae bacterium]
MKSLSMYQAKLRPGGKVEVPNPNAPKVAKNGGLTDAIVLLRGVDLKQSRPWDLHSVRVELTEQDFLIQQGDRRSRIGIVRRGNEAEFVARDDSTQSARARGASFFTQMLFVKDQPVSRMFSNAGTVELTSGSGYFWMRGYLAVSDHPYVGVSNEGGEVRFDQVPEGTYELISWKANWHIARIERDPEWQMQASLDYAQPLEKKQSIRVQAGQETRSVFTLQTSDFASN